MRYNLNDYVKAENENIILEGYIESIYVYDEDQVRYYVDDGEDGAWFSEEDLEALNDLEVINDSNCL